MAYVCVVHVLSQVPDSPGAPGGQPPQIWPGPHPSHPIMLPGMPGWGSGGARPPSGPVDPGYSPPWAQAPVDPGYGFPIGGRPPSGPVDPGYSPPWAQLPVDPNYGIPIVGGGPVDPGYSPPWAQVPPGTRPPAGGGPVDPGYSPPWAQVPPGGERPPMPPPGSPPVVIQGSQPVHPMTPPPAIIVQYPGVGRVLVPLPTSPAAPVEPPPVEPPPA